MQSEFFDTRNTIDDDLEWTMESGTVKSFDIDFEAIGANDSFRIADALPKATPVEAKARDLNIAKPYHELTTRS